MIDLDQWLVEMEDAEQALPIALEIVVAETAQLMAERARGFIGHLQPALSRATPVPGYIPAWEPLAQSTLDDKRNLGITGADGEPLHRTGQMEASIEGVSERLTGGVVSNDPVALWQEEGTAKIPPRPFLARAVLEGLPILELKLYDVAKHVLMPVRP